MCFRMLWSETHSPSLSVLSQVGYLGPGDENVAASEGAPSEYPDPVESLNLPAYQEEGRAWRSAAAAAECPWRDASWMPVTETLGVQRRIARVLLLCRQEVFDAECSKRPNHRPTSPQNVPGDNTKTL